LRNVFTLGFVALLLLLLHCRVVAVHLRPGAALARLPVDPMYGKVLLAGAAGGCAVEAMQLVAVVSADNVFHNPR
jgi:hypothetical protein